MKGKKIYTSKKRAEHLDEALAMREKGMSYRAIAKKNWRFEGYSLPLDC
ncbi:MAG: hypothetical protein LIP02_14655 [Bacteroidales bacterium]|nr:hypothetical protein [Bacteroidales bacterium]